MNKSLIFFLPLFLAYSPAARAQGDSHPGTRPFQLLLWPGRASLVRTATSEEWIEGQLFDAWHDGNLLTYMGRTIRIIPMPGGSLDKYLRVVLNTRPECVEGDPGFIEQEVNRPERVYLPLLQIRWKEGTYRPSMTGEILFLDHAESWQGTLGVVHPHYGIGGGLQIE
ncbi:MAG: hypothetical protein ACE15F_20630, partial [bacterium]